MQKSEKESINFKQFMFIPFTNTKQKKNLEKSGKNWSVWEKIVCKRRGMMRVDMRWELGLNVNKIID